MTTKEAAHILRNCFSTEPQITPAAEVEQAAEIAIEALEWIDSKVGGKDGKSAVKAIAKMFEENETERLVNAELSFRQGIINGLKYAMRCNGVSGGEVKD